MSPTTRRRWWLRSYMQRSFDVMHALRELGRGGDFNRVPELRKKYKSHRTTSGLAPRAENSRTRGNWGEIQHARFLTPLPP